MLQSELSSLQDFLSGLQTVEELIKRHFSQKLNCEEVAINIFPLLIQSLVCKFDQKNSHHISIEELMQLFMRRWIHEMQYCDEIIQIKDQIIRRFNKLCDNVTNESIVEFIREHRQKIVELLLAKAQIDNKQKAGEFCKGIMNGFELEMLDKIDHYICYVLWTSYTMPRPQWVYRFANDLFEKEVIGEPNKENIAKVSEQIARFIENHFERVQIDTGKQQSGIIDAVATAIKGISKEPKRSLTLNELESRIDMLRNQRKSCFLIVKEISKYEKIIINKRLSIDFIIVRMAANDFMKKKVSFYFDGLILDSTNEKTDWNKIVSNIPRELKFLLISQNNNAQEKRESNMIEKMKNMQMNSNELIIDLNYNWHVRSEFKLIISCIENIKIPLYLRLCMSDTSYTSDEEQIKEILVQACKKKEPISHDFKNMFKIQILGVSIYQLTTELKNVNDLIIDLRSNIISSHETVDLINFKQKNPNCQLLYDNACIQKNFRNGKMVRKIEKLAVNLNSVPRDVWVFLYLSANDQDEMAGDNLIKLMHILLIHASQVVSFGFNIKKENPNNGIGREGMEEVAKAMNNMKNLFYLSFNLECNKIGVEGAKILQIALNEMSSMIILNLNLKDNEIGVLGAKSLSAALKELKNISNLNLNLEDNKIEGEGAKAIFGALDGLVQISTLNLNFQNNEIGKEGENDCFTGLGGLKHILTLNLNFMKNKIKNKEVVALSSVLSKLKTISILNLNLENNEIGSNGATALSDALKELKCISTLELNLGLNFVENTGVKSIFAALKELKSISALNLNLKVNNIQDEGAITISNDMIDLKNVLDLELNLAWNGFKTKGRAVLQKLKTVNSNHRILYCQTSFSQQIETQVIFYFNSVKTQVLWHYLAMNKLFLFYSDDRNQLSYQAQHASIIFYLLASLLFSAFSNKIVQMNKFFFNFVHDRIQKNYCFYKTVIDISHFEFVFPFMLRMLVSFIQSNYKDFPNYSKMFINPLTKQNVHKSFKEIKYALNHQSFGKKQILTIDGITSMLRVKARIETSKYNPFISLINYYIMFGNGNIHAYGKKETTLPNF